MKKVFGLAVLCLAFAFTAFAMPGGGPEGGPGMGAGGPHAGMGPDIIAQAMDELDLSKEQVAKLREMQSKSKREMIPIHAEMQVASLDIQDELAKDKPDQAKIDAAIDRLNDSAKKMMKFKIGNMLEAKKILTKEQFDKLLASMYKKGIGKGKKGMFGKNAKKDCPMKDEKK